MDLYLLGGAALAAILAMLALGTLLSARLRAFLGRVGGRLRSWLTPAPRPAARPKRAAYFVRNGQLEFSAGDRAAQKELSALVVARDHAVTVEDDNGGYRGMYRGPGSYTLPLGLRPAIVLITRPRYKRLSVSNIQTKEGLRIERVDFGVIYRIQRSQEEWADPVTHPPDVEALRRAAYCVAFVEAGEEQPKAVDSWEVAVQEVAKNSIRQLVASSLMDELFQTPPLREQDSNSPAGLAAFARLEERARETMQALAGEWGVEIQRVLVDGIWMDEAHRQVVAERWKYQKETQAEAERIEKLEYAKGQAWRRTVLDIHQALHDSRGGETAALRLIEFLKYLDTLVELGRTGGARSLPPVPSQIERLMVEPQGSVSHLEGMGEPDSDASETAPSQAAAR